MDYFVPNFGEDYDIAATKKHIAAAEKKHGVWIPQRKTKTPPPKDYFVPNLGLDKDILDAQSSIKNTEKNLGGWNPK